MKVNIYLLFVFIMIALAISSSSYYIQCQDINYIQCQNKNNNENKMEDRKTLSIVTILLSIVLLITTCFVVYFNNYGVYNGYFYHFEQNHEYLYYYLLFVGTITILSFATSSILIDCYRKNQDNDQMALPSVNIILTFIFFFFSIYLYYRPPNESDITDPEKIKILKEVKNMFLNNDKNNAIAVDLEKEVTAAFAAGVKIPDK